MKKICFCNPLRFGHFGDTTRIVEFWSRIPRLLNTQVYIFTYDEDTLLSNMEYFKPIKLRTCFFGKRIRYVSRVLSHLFVVLHAVFVSDLACVYEIQTTLNITGLLISKIRKIPLVYEVNTILEYEKEKTFLNNLIIKIARITEEWTVNRAKKILVTTVDIKKRFHEEYSIPLEKIEIVPNAANIDLFYPMDKFKCRRELGLDQNVFIVCFVGGLGEGHGAKNLAKSAPNIIKEIPNTKFLIVGDGPKRVELERESKSVGVKDSFIFTGAVPYEKVPKYINSSDVCVILNRNKLKEKVGGGAAVKLYEYMACGKPVIGTKGQSSFNLLGENNAGLVVNVDKVDEIAEAVITLLDDRNLRDKLGGNGRKLVEEKYNWEVIAKQVATVCTEAVKK